MTIPDRPRRPWYCNDRLVDDHKASIRDGGDLSMFKTLKLVRSIIVNIGIIVLGIYALHLGADPTIVGAVSIFVVGGYNGLELGDYAAAVHAYQEIQSEDQLDDRDSRD